MAKGKASNFFVWVILLLLIVGLAGFGATNFGGSVQSVGTRGRARRSRSTRYACEMQQELRALAAEQGRTVPMTEAQAVRPADRRCSVASSGTPRWTDEAAALGLSVGDEAVREQILAIPAFQGVDGKFDREAYGFTLDRSGLNVAEFEERIRTEPAANLVQSAVASGVTCRRCSPNGSTPMRGRRGTSTWARLGPG